MTKFGSRGLPLTAAAGLLAGLSWVAASPALAASSGGTHHTTTAHVAGHLHPVAGRDYATACSTARALHFSCLALVRTNVKQHLQPVAHPDTGPTGDGYGPASLQRAYDLPSATKGSGETVAVVDAYNDPNIVSDLATYRSAWGLPACGSGCFSVVNENGATSPLPPDAGSSGWDVEESLDVDMVSAICPNCHITLVEASSTSVTDLGTGVDSAVALGADFVSNSYATFGESSSETSWDAYYNHPGVAVTASAGDDGYLVSYPAASQYVTSVGGTSLSPAGNLRGWTESTWGGTGSGCSAYEAKPSWQTDTGCSDRTDNDAAAVADPSTGVAVYDTYSEGGWLEVGGTSASSPIIASTFALAGTPAAGTYPSSYIYKHRADLYDVTSGSDGSCSPAYLCTAGPGYDGPTGWGTPDTAAAFSHSSAAWVTGLKATAKYTNLAATWKASSGATGYKVTVTTHKGSVTIASTVVTGTSYHLGGLHENTSYAVHVLSFPTGSGQTPATVYVTTK
jgi:subtilase family serine protease